MAELTLEDRENYEKLKTAFAKLPYKFKEGNIKTILNQIITRLNSTPQNTDELKEAVTLVDGYLKIVSILDIKPYLIDQTDKNVEDVKNLHQEVLNFNNRLITSIKVVEETTLDLTDEIESFCSDSLFLEFLRKLSTPDLVKLTEALLSERIPNLDDTQINQLIQAWGKVVHKFVEDARKKGEGNGRVTPGQSETFASFFCIHSELETLYTRLADTATVQQSR